MAALLASAFSAHAAGLGRLTVYSAIGQPLNAEIALTASSEELISLTAKLGSYEAFKDAGVEFMPALAGVRFNVVKQPNNQSLLKLTTDRPLNEPFLHFLVELNWSSGRMVREYTFLLDPPEMLQPSKPASVVAPVTPTVTPLPSQAPAAAPLQAPRPAATPVAEPAPAAKPMPTAVPKPAVASKPAAPAAGEMQVRVKPGDTLSKIARENKPESASLDQMLVALFNTNREVFDGNNMNRLRAGKILRLPDVAEVVQLDTGEAHKLVVSQAADFNAYRRRLASAAAAAPVAETPPQQQVAGKIKPQIEEKAPAPAAKDKLEVSRTEAPKSGKVAGKGSLEEDLIARDKALREAADRIAELEKNLDNLRQLVELKSQAGAQAQQQAQVVAPKPAPEVKKPEPAKPAAEPPKAPEPAKAPEPPKAEEPKPPVSTPAAAAEEKPVEPVAAAPQAETAKSAEPAEPPKPKPAPNKPVPPPSPPSEPSFIEDNPEIVFGGGAILALLLGYFGFKTWKKKREEKADFVEEPSVSTSELASTSGAIFGAASESVDSGEVSIQGDFSEGGVLTTEESVDPVAEADVYMAYGRDSQAEEILLEGLKSDPTRTAIHLKLLELYANRKSADQFEGIAGQLHGLTEGQGPDWEKAAAMAAGLGIGGGLFAAAATAEPVAAMPAAEEFDAEPVAEAAASTVITHADDLAAAPAEEAVEAAVAAPEEDASLDFDLDLGTTSSPAAAAAEAPTAQPAPAEEAMSLDFDFDLGTPEPAAAAEAEVAPAEVAEAVPAADANMIDFALDIGSTPAAPAEESVAEAAPTAAEAGNEIDFDLDLGSTEAPADSIAAAEEPLETALPAAETEAPAPAGGLGDLKIDFDLDLGSGSAAESAAAAPEAPAIEADLDSALADIDLDLDLPAVEAPAPEAEVAMPEVELPEVELPEPEIPMAAEAQPEAGGEVDFDLALDMGDVLAETPVADEAAPAIDMSGLDLAEPVAETVAAEPEQLASLPDIELDETPAASEATAEPEAADDPEVATKLELAQAYEEMGDREGARELLNEVLNEGSLAQQELARARLAQLEV